MTKTRECRCGFEGRAALSGYARLLLAAAMVVTAVATALGAFPARYEINVTAALFALTTLSATADITAIWANDRLEQCTGQPHWTATGGWRWRFLLTVFVTVAALFAADREVLATVVEIYFLARVAIEGMIAAECERLYADDECTTLDPDQAQTFMVNVARYAKFGLVAMLAATTWVATGAAAGWPEHMTLSALWIIVLTLLFGEACLIWKDIVADYLPPQRDGRGPLFLAEPRKGLEDLPLIRVSRAGRWLANGGILLLVYELSLAHQTALAALFVPLPFLASALNIERRLRVPEDQRGEIARPILALHAAVRDIARALHLAVAAPVRAVRRLLGRRP